MAVRPASVEIVVGMPAMLIDEPRERLQVAHR